MRYIKQPTKFDELKLSQLIAYGDYLALIESGKLDADMALKSISIILGITPSEVERMSKATLTKFNEVYLGSVQDVFAGYKKAFDNPKGYFTSALEPSWKADITETKKQAKKLKKRKFFEIDENPTNEPVRFWIDVMDGIEGKMSKIEKVQHEWQFIPKILALFAWRKNEDRFTKNFNGVVVADMDRIKRMEEVFLELNAVDAIKAFSFFLCKRQGYSVTPVYSLYLKRYREVILKSVAQEKSTIKKEDGMPIS